MPLADLRFKSYLAIRPVFELSQPRQSGFLALAEIGENLMEYTVQAIGSLSLADSRPPGQLSGDVGLPHIALTISACSRGCRHGDPEASCKPLKTRYLRNAAKIEIFREWKKVPVPGDELILIGV